MANKNCSFEVSLFNTADRLRKNIDEAEYKNVVLGLIFLKYISDAFQELYARLEQDDFSDPEGMFQEQNQTIENIARIFDMKTLSQIRGTLLPNL